jgi:hypothetical protein
MTPDEFEDLIDRLSDLAPEDRARIAAHFGVGEQVADAFDEDPLPSEFDSVHDWAARNEELSIAETNARLQDWRGRNYGIARSLSPDQWEGIGEYVQDGLSVDEAWRAYSLHEDEQDTVADIARIQRAEESRQGRPLTRGEVEDLHRAYARSEDQDTDEIDDSWRLDIDTSEGREEYLNRVLTPEDDTSELDAHWDDSVGGLAFNLDDRDKRSAALAAMLGGEDVIDVSPTHDAADAAEED